MSNKAIGCDVGTAFFQTASYAEDNKINFSTIRNAFVEINHIDDVEDILHRNNWQYVKDGNSYYVIGEDCMQVAKLFPNINIRRPLQDGVLNKDEDKKLVVLAEMIKSSIGSPSDDKSVVCTCVSSPSADFPNQDNAFHKARLEAMFSRLGWNVKVIDEALAIIFSERPVVSTETGEEIPYSGIGISFGGGRTNCVLAYKGMQVLGMSVVRGRDYVDKQVSLQTGSPISQIINVKEKKLDFRNINYDNDIEFALDAYYEELIKYVFNHFGKKFAEVKSEFDYPLDLVVAGGTSMPKGFVEKIQKVVSEMKLPFKIKTVRRAKDPRNAVVEGLLIQASIIQKKMEKANQDDDIDKILG